MITIPGGNAMPVGKDFELNREEFEKLAVIMALNSVWNISNRGSNEEIVGKIINVDNYHSRTKHVVITIVGAGASYAANKLPLAKDTADNLKKEISNRMPPVENLRSGSAKRRTLVDEEIERLSLQYNLPESDFETILLAISKFDRSHVIKRLQELYASRHTPWLGYEILSHLLKHRFVDVVINFNFDELLDQTINDELGEGAIYKIILEGDCPQNVSDWMDDDRKRFKRPLYFKPHGSVSQPSSLRFTRDSYVALPEQFIKLMNNMLQLKQPIVVLVIGFAMQSIEFNHIIRRTAIENPDTQMTFYFLEERSDRLSAFADKLENVRSIFPKFPPSRGSRRGPVTTETLRIDLRHFLSSLWGIISEKFTERKPRGVDRHELIDLMFGTQGGLTRKTDDELHSYFRQRTYVEIGLSLAKARGFASLSNLYDERVGYYYKLYKEFRLRNHRDDFGSLSDACRKLGLFLEGYGDSVVKMYNDRTALEGVCGRMAQEGPGRSFALNRDELIKYSPIMIENILNRVSLHANDREPVRKKLLSTFTALFDSEEVDVSISRAPDRSYMFHQPEIITSFLSLQWITDDIFEKMSWDTVLCTAKSGSWLLDEKYVKAIKKRNALLGIVVGDSIAADEIALRYDGHIFQQIRRLPWWLHNRTVTIFLKNGKLVEGIYFERRIRNTNILPIYLSGTTDDDDLKYLWYVFVAYWFKAIRFIEKKEDQYAYMTVLEKDGEALLQQLKKARYRAVRP
jgi:hypothetical protein